MILGRAGAAVSRPPRGNRCGAFIARPAGAPEAARVGVGWASMPTHGVLYGLDAAACSRCALAGAAERRRQIARALVDLTNDERVSQHLRYCAASRVGGHSAASWRRAGAVQQGCGGTIWGIPGSQILGPPEPPLAPFWNQKDLDWARLESSPV